MVHVSELPDFDKIPKVDGMPAGTAWHLYSENGERDYYGTLNLLTPDIVLEANKEVQKGISVALNWPMQNTNPSGFGRKPLDHKIIDLKPLMDHWVCDDELSFNTQVGSQWDGFKHWAHQATALYYDNHTHEESLNSKAIGIHHWSKRGGIVGRAVLLDYVAYAERHGIKYDPWTRHEIHLKDLEAIIAEQKVELKPADILIVRSGWVKRYNEGSYEQRLAGMTEDPAHVGVQGCEEIVKWLWNHRFSAIAGDAIAWEAWPPNNPDWIIHDWSLALAGRPIGELWDLERLAEVCKEQNRYSFFLASAPLNVEGGVASPPNALAIF